MDMNQDSPKSELTVIIAVPEFYPALYKAVRKTCGELGHGDDVIDSIINALLLHVIQFQSSNNAEHLERHVKMAINILRDNGIEDPAHIIGKWTPVLLAVTSKFIKLKLVDRTPIWRMIAHVEGSLYLTPE